MGRFDLSDDEWALVGCLLPGTDGKRGRGRPARINRRVINGMFIVIGAGIPWRDLPARFGPYTIVYNRFTRWSKVGVWERILRASSERSIAAV